MIIRIRAVSAIAVVVLAACAANTSNLKPADTSAAVAGSSACQTKTGTLITHNNASSPDFVRCHSENEILHTGSPFEVAHALTVLDPAVTLQH